MNRANPSRRLSRTASVVLPVIAVGIVVLSLIAATGGGATAPVHKHLGHHSLASLLSGGHEPGKHGSTKQHRPTAISRPVQRGGHQPTYRSSGHEAVAYRTASAHDVAVAPTTQVIANLRHSTKGYPSRNSLSSNRQVPGSWYGHQSALPVIAATEERLLVRLAQRPNESTTWIKRDKAVLRVTHWAVVVDVSRHFLYVFYKGYQQYAFPVGTGTSRTPTPTGQFFVAFHSGSNGPGYGPVNIATSGHSTALRTFDGGDDAIIGIHGPVGSDSQIGDHGAAISNGCIRMHLGDLAKVTRHVPDGAPVVITR